MALWSRRTGRQRSTRVDRWRPGGRGGVPAVAPWLCVAAFRRLCSEQRAAGEGLARRQPPHPTATYGEGLSGSVIWINLAKDARQGHSSFFNGTFPLPCSVTVRSPSGVSKNTDRKSTRLNSSHLVISYAVFCLKKKKMLIQECIIV